MTIRRIALMLCVATIALGGSAAAATLIVDAGGGGQFTSIQPALDAAGPDDTVLVVAGLYTGAANRDLSFGGKNLTLASVSGAAATVIDAAGGGRAFAFTGGESVAAQVKGFTIRRAVGGAVYCQNASPTFKDCILVENANDQPGGAVVVQGGLPTFDGCTVVGNSSALRGGGFWIGGGANVGLVNTTITGNDAGLNGGGIFVAGASQVTLQRTILWGNRAGTFDDLFATAGCTATVLCSDIDVGGAGGGGVIALGPNVLTGDPHFCQPAYCRAQPWTDGDYGLAANSPCLPANSPCGQLIGAWPQACDDVVVWTGGGGTTAWENPANWSTHALPGHGDNVQITTGDVVLSSAAEIGWLTQCNESDTPQLTFTIAAGGHLRLGYVNADKEIKIATVTSDKTVIENGGDASTGTTAPHPWDLLGLLDLNGGGLNGHLQVENEGSCTVNDGGGFGPNVRFTNHGVGAKARAAGSLLVGGGTLTAAGSVVNQGEVTVAGGATLQLAGTLENQATGHVALAGSIIGVGQLSNLGTIEKSGAAASDVDAAIDNLRDDAHGQVGAITVSAGTWRVGGAFTNAGLVTVAAGATLARSGTVENLADGVVVLAGGISGGGTLTNLGLIQRGGPGTSVVAGLLRNTFDQASGDRGRLAVVSGVLSVAGLENNGTTTVSGGATLTASGHLTNGIFGRLAGSGSCNVATAAFTNLGQVSPGQSPGTLTVVGNYPAAASSGLFVELGGTVPGAQYDRLAVSGTATVGGALHVSLVNGFVPTPGDSFLVLTVGPGGWLPSFTCTSGLQLAPNLFLQPVVRPNGLLLVAVAGSAGNHPPVAVDDTLDVPWGGPVTVLPLANDGDVDGDGLSLVTITTTTTVGQAYLAADGESIVYLPPPTPLGEDSLTYVVTDCEGGTDEATVVIRFTNATDAPPPDAGATAYRLHANAPNPFNPRTRIRFDLPRPGPARVAVYDLRGRLVQILADGNLEAGSFTADWFGRDSRGGAVAAGVYVVRLEAPGHVSSRKMTLVR